MQEKPIPVYTDTAIPTPPLVIAENTVSINGNLIEIKPTKLKYMRNRTAAFYKMLESYPLPDILAMDAGTFGDDRDGDKAVMDFLIAVTDNEKLIVENYNEIDAGVVESILAIYRRVNKIDEKEERLKNLIAPKKGA